jgi:hypothetical protein
MPNVLAAPTFCQRCPGHASEPKRGIQFAIRQQPGIVDLGDRADQPLCSVGTDRVRVGPYRIEIRWTADEARADLLLVHFCHGLLERSQALVHVRFGHRGGKA